MRDKLIELLSENFVDFCHVVMVAGNCKISAVTLEADKFADHLIAHGVTVSNVPDTNVGKWIPVSERLPEPFVYVLVQMPGEKPLPTVREGNIARDGLWYAGYFTREPGEVTHWMPLPEAPKEGE